MSIYGIENGGYPAMMGYRCVMTGYRYGRTERGTGAESFTKYAETFKRSDMADGNFVLHYFDHEDGERTVGASCGRDYSISAYIPKDFDSENPVYKVKVWDRDGNVTERLVDVSKVDPQNSDYMDMFAYSSYLECSGKCPGAQSAFMGSAGDPCGMLDLRYEDLFDRTNWMERLGAMMQMQYDAGNLTGYLEYKKFWDFLEEGDTAASRRETEKYGKISESDISADRKTEEKIKEDAEEREKRKTEEKLTVSYNGIALRERSSTDKKYTDKETGISWYVADGKYPYITGEDADKLRKLCEETGEFYLKKMAEITGNIRHLDENTTAYIADNGIAVMSKDGRQLSIDTSALSYDVLTFLFNHIGASGDYFNEKFWAGKMQDAIGNYLTAQR